MKNMEGFQCVKITVPPYHTGEGNRAVLHVGHINMHYFLIKNTKDLNTLSASDFEKFASQNDKFIEELDTSAQLKTRDMMKVGGNMMCDDKKIFQ